METKLRELVERYRDGIQDREAELDLYRDEAGDVPSWDLRYYDEQRTDNAYNAEVDLGALLDELEALISKEESK